MTIRHLHFLPLATFVLIPSTILITYVLAILLNHVDVDFPYISDSGTLSPESNIFAQMFNIAAALALCSIYVRFKQVEQFYRDDLSSRAIVTLNSVAFWMGALASLGMTLVANFQETAVLEVHLIGATVLFFLGTIYMWLQTAMSYRMLPLLNSLKMARTRLVLSAIATLGLLSTTIFAGISLSEFHGDNKRKWTPKDGGFAAHVTSAASEWTLALAVDFFFLTFVKEFQLICLESPKVSFLTPQEYGLPTSDLYQSQDQLEIGQNGASFDGASVGEVGPTQKVVAVVH